MYIITRSERADDVTIILATDDLAWAEEVLAENEAAEGFDYEADDDWPNSEPENYPVFILHTNVFPIGRPS